MDLLLASIGMALIIVGAISLNVWLIGIGIALILALCIF
jgi:hypothetical protein